MNRDDLRTPQQQRSIERVDSILDAAKALIAKHGSAGLKIRDIADLAGITAGSIYQYFPNKAAIIHALGKQHLDHVNDSLQSALTRQPESIDECISMLYVLFDQFHALNQYDPVIQDIWVSTSADKSLQDMDIEDSRRNAKLIFEHIKVLFPTHHWEDVERLLFLSMHLCGATMRLAQSLDEREGEAMLALAKSMITPELLHTYTDAQTPSK